MKRALALMLVVAGVAAIAITAGGATAAPAKKQDTNAQRRGQLVRLPARVEMDPGTRLGVRIQRLVLADRLRRRHRGRSPPARSTSAPSDAPLSDDQLTACKGCVQVPWALSATSMMYNLPGINCVLRLTGPILANIYLGEDHDLGRRIDQEGQPEVQPAGHEDHARVPLGQLRHDVQLHRLPVRRQPGLEVEARRRRQRAVAGRRRCARQLRRLGRPHEDGGRDRLRRRRVRAQEQDPLRVGPERVRQVRNAGPARNQGRGRHAAEEDLRQRRALDREPAEGQPARVSDLDLHLRDRADRARPRRPSCGR